MDLAETLLFGVLCGLHVNGANAESNLPSLLTAGVKVYSSVQPDAARARLRPIIAQAVSASGHAAAVVADNGDDLLNDAFQVCVCVCSSPRYYSFPHTSVWWWWW